jgi:hypothetical protein
MAAVKTSRPRPLCRSCGRPLDLFIDPDSGEANFECHTKMVGCPPQTDQEYQMAYIVLTPAQRDELFKGIK